MSEVIVIATCEWSIGVKHARFVIIDPLRTEMQELFLTLSWMIDWQIDSIRFSHKKSQTKAIEKTKDEATAHQAYSPALQDKQIFF